MFTVGAFDEDRAAAVTTLETLDAVDDDHIHVSDDDLFVPELDRLIGVYVFHGYQTTGNPTGCRITSPTLRRDWPLDIAKMNRPDEEPTDSQVAMFPQDPLPLAAGEALNALMTNTAITSARGIVGVFFADGAIAPIHGLIRTIKCTSTLTGTADVWSSGPLTLAQDLAVGRYQVVGARCIDPGVWGLFRLIFTGYTWRPGGVMGHYLRYAEPDIFRKGRLGVWGEFRQDAPPRLEVLAAYAASNPEVYLDLIRIA